MATKPSVAEPICRILNRFPQIPLVYLFGSQARGDDWTTPLSDVDIAVLMPEPDNDVLGEFHDNLVRVLAPRKVDFVDLRYAPCTVAYRVVSEGIELACRDETLRIRFEEKAILEYLDFQPILRQAYQTQRQCLRRGEMVEGRQGTWRQTSKS